MDGLLCETVHTPPWGQCRTKCIRFAGSQVQERQFFLNVATLTQAQPEAGVQIDVDFRSKRLEKSGTNGRMEGLDVGQFGDERQLVSGWSSSQRLARGCGASGGPR